MKTLSFVSAIAVFLPMFAHAEDLKTVSLEFGASTLGLSAIGGFRPTGHLGTRLGFNTFSLSRSLKVSSIRYSGKAELQSFDLILDYYPNKTGLRFSGGVIFSQNRFSGKASETIIINGKNYGSASVDASAHYNPVAPYLGVGYVIDLGSGFQMSTDIGAFYQGNSKVSYRASGSITDAKISAAKSQLEDELNKASLYPVVSISLGYRF